METHLTKLEMLLSCALLVSMIGVVYFAFVIPSEYPKILKSTVEACNANYEAMMVNTGRQSPYSVSGWDIRDHFNSSALNTTLTNHNLTIETGMDRKKRLE